MGVEELVGWLHLPQSSPMQMVLDTPGCPAEGQESWPLSGPGAGHEVALRWFGAGVPFLEGTAKASSLSQIRKKQQSSCFLSIRSCRHGLGLCLNRTKASFRKLLFREKYLFGKCHLQSSRCNGCISSGKNEVCNAWNWCLDQL